MVPTLDQKWLILFDNKLMVANDSPESTETNIYPFVINHFYLNEIILDCANGM